jgi:hypothetical protein
MSNNETQKKPMNEKTPAKKDDEQKRGQHTWDDEETIRKGQDDPNREERGDKSTDPNRRNVSDR